MVSINKNYRLVNTYRGTLTFKLKTANGQNSRGYRSKIRVLDFYLKNGFWPSRAYAATKTERSLGTKFGNYVAKTSPCYDASFRAVAMATGRTSNHKRPHNVKAFKQEILDFIKTHGRVPTTRSGETVEGEGCLRNKLDYYTKQGNDMTLLGKVYEGDKCHKSGIPAKFRALINESLDTDKPLIRLV